MKDGGLLDLDEIRARNVRNKCSYNLIFAADDIDALIARVEELHLALKKAEWALQHYSGVVDVRTSDPLWVGHVPKIMQSIYEALDPAARGGK